MKDWGLSGTGVPRAIGRCWSSAEKAGAIRAFSALAVAVGCLTACGGTAPESGATAVEAESLRIRVENALKAHGVAHTTFVIDQSSDTVLVDGDIQMHLDRLLGEVPHSADLLLPSLTPKGYYRAEDTHNVSDVLRVPQSFTPPKATSVQLSFGSGVSDAWQTAFTQAASQWSAATCIKIGTGLQPAATLRIFMASINNSNTYAVADFPHTIQTRFDTGGISPGSAVWVNSSFGCAPGTCGSIEGLSAQLKLQVALHEMGHTLGFTHPGLESQINGTASGTAYSTVMVAAFGEPGIGALTSDDVASRDIVFAQHPGRCDGHGVCGQPFCP